MAHQKALKLAFVSSFVTRRPTSSFSQCFMNLQLSRIAASRYCTASGKCRRIPIDGHSINAHEIPGNTKYMVLAGGLITIVGGYFMYHSKERKSPTQARRASRKEVIIDHKATIGGPFSLINHKGESVTDRDLKGQWTPIYFGYTSCPDDCPEELQKVADVVRIVEEQMGETLAPVFITLDPKRDSPAQLQAYLSEFHPRFVGLTGTGDDIRQVAREYRVFYKRVEDEGSDYLVDHSNLVYLMNPNVEFVKFFGKEYDAKALSLGVIDEMKKHNSATI